MPAKSGQQQVGIKTQEGRPSTISKIGPGKDHWSTGSISWLFLPAATLV